MNMDRGSESLRSTQDAMGSISTQQSDTTRRRQEWSCEQIYAALLGGLEGEHKIQSGSCDNQVRNEGSQERQEVLRHAEGGGDTKTIATDITGQGEGGGKGDLQVLAWTGWMKGLCARFHLRRRWMKPSVAEDWRCSRWGSLQDTGFPVSPEWNITVLKIICYYLWPIVYFQKPKPSQLVANVLIQSSTERD